MSAGGPGSQSKLKQLRLRREIPMRPDFQQKMRRDRDLGGGVLAKSAAIGR
jgi:hypothetical protein